MIGQEWHSNKSRKQGTATRLDNTSAHTTSVFYLNMTLVDFGSVLLYLHVPLISYGV